MFWNVLRAAAPCRISQTGLWLGWPLAALLCVAGCSSGDTQTRYRVSGTVTFDGQPVPYGEVLFTPDGAQGNSGAQGIAEIRDGRYDTDGSRAPGVAGGPTVVTVAALSDESGKLLAEYEFKIDLPRADSTHNIEIPRQAGKKGAGPEI